MGSWIEKIQSAPTRGRVLALVGALPIVLGIFIALAVDLVAGLVVVFVSTLPVLAGQYLSPRPGLNVAFASDDGTHSESMTFTAGVQRRIERAAILEQEGNKARATMPRPPMPPRHSNPKIAGILAAQATAIGTLRGPFDPSDKELYAFLGEVNEHIAELEQWLGDYQRQRDRKLRQLEPVFRVENHGEAPAQNVRLRLLFPNGFEEVDNQPWVDDPPERPAFQARLPFTATARLERYDLSHLVPPSPEQIRGVAPQYFREGKHFVVEYTLGALNHGPDHLRTGEAELRAPRLGTYEIEWELLAAGAKPARGKLQIEIASSDEIEEPLKTLSEVMAERDELNLD